jgi:hypothetical protein
MPCIYETPQETAQARARDLNELTSMLCELAQHIEATGGSLTPRARVWWEKHQASDAARRERERTAAQVRARHGTDTCK